ncbi:hypothetical protein HDU93_008242 [Gonapodya sp. JEL0774]|nr:hypothetical protein HDU93_008242 [Gonapodya sp. JEL0774]
MWVLATIAASSGGLVDGLLSLRKREWKFATPSAVSSWKAGTYTRIVAAVSAVYIALTDPLVFQWTAHVGHEVGLGDWSGSVSHAKNGQPTTPPPSHTGLVSPSTAQVLSAILLITGHVYVLLVMPYLDAHADTGAAAGAGKVPAPVGNGSGNGTGKDDDKVKKG